MAFIPEGTSVQVLGKGELSGTIVGRTTECSSRNDWFYIVELDEGFWNSEHTCFTSLLVVHRESLWREDG